MTLDNLFLVVALIAVFCAAFLFAGLVQWIAARRLGRQSWRHKGVARPMTMREHIRSLDD